MKTHLALITSLSFVRALAADFHASPEGSGSRDGTSAGNAAPASAIASVFNDRMQPGDRLLLASGDYPKLSLSILHGGTTGKPNILEGTPETILSSDWSIEKPDKGTTAISFGPGASHVVLKNLSIRNHCFAIRATPSEDAPRIGIILENIRMEQMRHGIYVSDCDDLSITGVTMKRYSKHGFRLDQGCDGVTLRNCLADCSEGDAAWETKTEVFPFGFNVNNGGAPNTRIRFEDCVAKNNIKSNQTAKYTNGDGFVVEGNSSDVTFIRCHAFRNQDGGFDLKVKDVTLTGCIATGHRRDFRIWATGTLTNCFAGWSQTGFWTKGGPITIKNSTFIGHRRSALEIEDNKPTGPITLADSLIASDEAKFTPAYGSYQGADTNIIAKSPPELGIANADPKWDGSGAVMDSSKYPAKGYRSAK